MSGTQQPAIDQRMLMFVVSVGTQQYRFVDKGLLSSPGLYMTAKGSKYANAIQNECTIEIGNLTTIDKNFILSETSPFNQNKDVKTLAVYAGRVSTGFALVFFGDITNSGTTQMPDVNVMLKSATGQRFKGFVVGKSRGAAPLLSSIAQGVASDLGLQLSFQAKDKAIGNYAFSGSQLREVSKLGETGNVNAYIDDNKLVVKDNNQPLANSAVVISAKTGMIGIPELTEEGVVVTFLFNNVTQLGGELQLITTSNPALNGFYTISKLDFTLSNRDTPFYYKATCVNPKLSAYIAAQTDSQTP